MDKPFMILSLPRSRSYWLSRLFSYNGDICRHDSALQLRSLEDIKSWFHPQLYGVVETAVSPYWRLLLNLHPGLKIVIVKRSVVDVVNSTLAADNTLTKEQLTKAMTRQAAKLSQIASRVPGCLVINYFDLDKEETVRSIWNYCMPYPFPVAYWNQLKELNLQISISNTLAYVADNFNELNNLYQQVRQQSFFNLRQHRLV